MSLIIFSASLVLLGVVGCGSIARHIGSAQAREEDQVAKATMTKVLRAIAQDQEDFHTYALVFTRGIQNTTPALKEVRTFKATGNGQRFVASVKSASGTTFTVRGSGRSLDLTCSPSDPDCLKGRWSGPTTLVMPAIPKITLADRQKVRTLLMNNVNHYQDLFLIGAWALGEKQYSNPLHALHDLAVAGSGPSTFANYQQRFRPTDDTSFLKAFKNADSFYVAANEPAAIGDWRDDMSNLTADLDGWISDAVGWQIKQTSNGKLAADENAIERDIAKSSTDVQKITRLPVKDPAMVLQAAGHGGTTIPPSQHPEASSSEATAVSALKQYWSDINSGDYTDAFDLETLKEQGTLTESAMQANDATIRIAWIKTTPIPISTNEVGVRIDIYAKNQTGSDLNCRNFSFEEVMTSTDGHWLYDGPIKTYAASLADGNPNCP
jgi:hypothetical protein